MVSITLSIPEETRKIMKDFPEINWTHLVRETIMKKAALLEIKSKMLSDLEKEKEFNEWAVRVVREGR